MSAINSGVPDKTDGTNTESKKETVDSTKNTPDAELQKSFGNIHLSKIPEYLPVGFNSSEDLSCLPFTQLAQKAENEVPHSTVASFSSPPFQQGEVLLHHAYYTNGCGVPQASVRQQPQHVSQKQRIGSTSSVCTKGSRKSCRSTASQIQEVAGDDRCAHCALACLFCEFVSLCSLALDCGGCGGCLEACCSGERRESLAESWCGEAGRGHCPWGLGCGMLQDCCSSSDCLEICLECCSICFPA